MSNKNKFFVGCLSVVIALSLFLLKFPLGHSEAEGDGVQNKIEEREDIVVVPKTEIGAKYTNKEIAKIYADQAAITLEEAEKIFLDNGEYRVITSTLKEDVKLFLYANGSSSNNKFIPNKIVASWLTHPNKNFLGQVFANIEDESTIYYDIYGSFLDEGKSSVNLVGALNITIGDGGKVINIDEKGIRTSGDVHSNSEALEKGRYLLIISL